LKWKIERLQSRKGVYEVLTDDFIRFSDGSEVDGSIPPQQMGQKNQELSGLLVGETDAQPIGGLNKELAQGTLMFHVEHLREMREEVKGSYSEEGRWVENELDWFMVDILLCFSRATSNTEMAAGVTPDMRDA
jgi:hypothetical protein